MAADSQPASWALPCVTVLPPSLAPGPSTCGVCVCVCVSQPAADSSGDEGGTSNLLDLLSDTAPAARASQQQAGGSSSSSRPSTSYGLGSSKAEENAAAPSSSSLSSMFGPAPSLEAPADMGFTPSIFQQGAGEARKRRTLGGGGGAKGVGEGPCGRGGEGGRMGRIPVQASHTWTLCGVFAACDVGRAAERVWPASLWRRPWPSTRTATMTSQPKPAEQEQQLEEGGEWVLGRWEGQAAAAARLLLLLLLLRWTLWRTCWGLSPRLAWPTRSR